MAFETRAVLHVDGKTTVKAKGLVINGEFIGEYKYQGMTYGVTIPNNVYDEEYQEEINRMSNNWSSGKGFI